MLGGSRKRSLYVYLIFVFGTVNLPHSSDGYEHVYEGLAIASSLAILLSSERSRNSMKWALVAGALIGLGLVFRNTIILAIPGLLIIAFRSRNVLPFLGAIFPFLLVVLLYNYFRFGSVFETGYTTAWQSANPDLGSGSGFNLMRAPSNVSALLLSPGKGMLIFSPELFLSSFAIYQVRRNHMY